MNQKEIIALPYSGGLEKYATFKLSFILEHDAINEFTLLVVDNSDVKIRFDSFTIEQGCSGTFSLNFYRLEILGYNSLLTTPPFSTSPLD